MNKSETINRLAILLARENQGNDIHIRAHKRAGAYRKEMQAEIDRLKRLNEDLLRQRAYSDEYYYGKLKELNEEIALVHEKYGAVCEAASLVAQSLGNHLSAHLGGWNLAKALREVGYEPFPKVAEGPYTWETDPSAEEASA